ncbi:hypothetical protein CXB51_034959 [Gossypium anomalum]|uniref:Uncharacterized protein n=1 Tax=Gossypium anomalum TaxID=47600 RepID=A0A8J5XNN2_9ROSI|nr:hypothetical protein CXB51_034959 [Gossypium anomalum]
MEALLSQFTFLSDQALQGNKNFDPSAMEDLMKLFEIESYKAWAALELVEEKQVKGAEITMPIFSFDQMGLKDDLLHGIYNLLQVCVAYQFLLSFKVNEFNLSCCDVFVDLLLLSFNIVSWVKPGNCFRGQK